MNTAINGLGKNFLSAGNFVVDKAKNGVSDIGKGLEEVGENIADVVTGKML